METKHFYEIWCRTESKGSWIWRENMIPPIGTTIQDFKQGKRPYYYKITGYSIINSNRYIFKRPSLIMHLTEVES